MVRNNLKNVDFNMNMNFIIFCVLLVTLMPFLPSFIESSKLFQITLIKVLICNIINVLFWKELNCNYVFIVRTDLGTLASILHLIQNLNISMPVIECF